MDNQSAPWMGQDPVMSVPDEASAEQLAALAASRPELWPAIAQHPNVYPELQQWIADQMRARAAEPRPDVEETPAKPRRTGLIVTAVVLVVILVLGGIAAALMLTGVFDRGPGGKRPVTAAVEQSGPSFADGIERMWTADALDYAVPSVGELGQDFAFLRAAYSRASIAMFEADYPVMTPSRVVFNARGQNSVLVMLDAASGDPIVEHDLKGRGATCAADAFAKGDVVYCVSPDEQEAGSTLFRIDAGGNVEEQHFDLPLYRVAVAKDRIVLVGQSGAALALDRSKRQLWERDDLESGGSSGVDLGGDRTLIRGHSGWTLLDAGGRTLATAKVVGPYEGGDGACDARLTASGKLFVAGGDACVDAEAGTDWWGFGKNLAGVYVFSADGRDYVLQHDDRGAELWRFPTSGGGALESVFVSDIPGEVVGVTSGEQPVLVMSGGGTAVSYSVRDGEEVASWSAPAPQRGWVFDQASRGSDQLLLDDAGVALLGSVAYDVYSGEQLWTLNDAEELRAAWMSEAGLIVLGGGCPECSIAGGAYTTSTITRYAPAGSGGETRAEGQSAVVDVVAPDTIPPCPGTTILLAWAEFSEGWVVVCGVDAHTPSYVQMRLPGVQEDLYSVGASTPTSSAAKQAVSWESAAKRYVAELANGDTLVLDHQFGTATVRGAGEDTSTQQQRMVRYVFVPLGSEVVTSEYSGTGTGAYGVQAPKATAEDQIRFMIEVLEKSYEGRAIVKEELPKLTGCTLAAGGYGDVIAGMRAVRDNRAELLQMLDSMPVDKIPEGDALLKDLRQAIQHSYNANVEYVTWAEAAQARGCASLSAAGQASVAASDPPKERFAQRWNRAVAPAYGVRTFDAWFI